MLSREADASQLAKRKFLMQEKALAQHLCQKRLPPQRATSYMVLYGCIDSILERSMFNIFQPDLVLDSNPDYRRFHAKKKDTQSTKSSINYSFSLHDNRNRGQDYRPTSSTFLFLHGCSSGQIGVSSYIFSQKVMKVTPLWVFFFILEKSTNSKPKNENQSSTHQITSAFIFLLCAFYPTPPTCSYRFAILNLKFFLIFLLMCDPYKPLFFSSRCASSAWSSSHLVGPMSGPFLIHKVHMVAADPQPITFESGA